MTLMLSAPLLLTALAVGLIVGIFQGRDSINEMTLSFIRNCWRWRRYSRSPGRG
jgi:flagellar biosynthesis protein FliQ